MSCPARLRLLFLASRDASHPQAAGGDIQLNTLAQYLVQRGHQVTYVCMGWPGASPEELRSGVRILRGLGSRAQALWAAWMYFRDWSRLIDVVVEEGIGGMVIPYMAPLYVRRPIITFWYQHNAPLFREQFSPRVAGVLGGLERILARLHRRAVIATPSIFQAKRLEALGFSPEQIRVVPNGLDWPVESLSSAPRETLVVYVGKLRRYKCPHHLLDVCEKLRGDVPELRVIIAGRPDGTGYDRWLEAEVVRRGLQGRVMILRSVSEQEKRDLLRRARVLILPSPSEGFGISVLEANRSGTPVVVSEGVPPEIVSHARNGFRFEFGDIEAMARATLRLLKDEAEWTRMSHFSWVEAQQHTWAQAATRMEMALDCALRSRS